MIVRNSAKQKIVDCVDFDGDENFSWAERNIEDRWSNNTWTSNGEGEEKKKKVADNSRL